MIPFLTETFHRLIDHVSLLKTRYLYPQFHLQNRLTGLVGPRGVGKTTLLLQYIKKELYEAEKTFYFSADTIYFQKTNLLEYVDYLHTVEGFHTVFIDEIHKYQNWNQELKNLYDAFPQLKIVFSGSSMLDLIQGSHDLSRRAKLFRLHGLSFREYLNFILDVDLQPLPFQHILESPQKCLNALKDIDRILPHFHDYLQKGYYPFLFEDPHAYFEKIVRVIDKTIFEDVANFYSLKTQNLHYFKQILTYLASIPPGNFNINSLSNALGIDNKTVLHYLEILVSVGLTRDMRPFESGGSLLRKPSKILLNNTNLIHALTQFLGQPLSKGLERELFFIETLENAGIEVFFSKQADYRTRHHVFEIGGKNKTRDQLKDVQELSFLVKDDILSCRKGEIPLFLLGFLY